MEYHMVKALASGIFLIASVIPRVIESPTDANLIFKQCSGEASTLLLL